MSPRGFTVPPGRAGRLWLDRRIGAAQRGAELLERKLRIVQAELATRQEAAAEAAARWARCHAAAEQWLVRAALLSGQRAFRLGADAAVADVAIGYTTTMGVRYPDSATCAIPPPDGWDSPVIAAARAAHRAALAAAVRHAAAAEALRVVEAEARATATHLRAIRNRWLPLLEQAMAAVTLALDEQELADAARLRLATRPVLPGRVARGGVVTRSPRSGSLRRSRYRGSSGCQDRRTRDRRRPWWKRPGCSGCTS